MRRSRPSPALLALATLAALPAAAQQTVSTLDAVQVQAARVRAVDDFDLPAALSTLQAGDSGNRAQAQLAEALAGVPGLLARDRQNAAQDTQLSIRGFGARSGFGVRGVRLLMDGIPATMPDGQGQLSQFNLFGAERIEVLRGPFSALYGNSSGGVLQVWSGDGEQGDPWRLRAHYGSHDSRTLGAQLRGRQGPLRYNLAATDWRSDGYREHSAAQRQSLNARLGWELAPGRRLDLLANHLDAPDAQDPLGLDRDQWRQDPRQATAVARQYDTRKSVRQSQLGLVLTEQGPSSTLRLMGYAGQRQVEQFLAIPPTAQASPLHAGGVIDLDSDFGGADLRWSWHGSLAGRALDVVVGTNADQQRQHRTGYENFIGQALGVRGRLRRDQHDRVHNLDQFVQAWWQPAPRWSVLAGVRHSRLWFRSDDHYLAPGNPDDSGRRDYGSTTPVAGVSFHAGDDLRLYASLGRGFETPTFNELGYRADGGAGLALDLRAARSRNLEVGSKWRGRNGAALELALFRADTDDELAVASNTGGRSSYRNIGRTRRQGAEARWEQPLGSSAALQLAWTWVDAQVRDGYLACSGSPCLQPTGVVAAGSPLPGMPRQQVQLRGTWQPRDWEFAAEWVAASRTPVDDLGSEAAPGYGLVHLEASRRWDTARGPLRVFARVDNVLDRAHVGSVIVNDGNRRFYEPGPGRRFGLGVEWQWAR